MIFAVKNIESELITKDILWWFLRVFVDDQRIKYYEGHLNLILQEEMDNLYRRTVALSKVCNLIFDRKLYYGKELLSYFRNGPKGKNVINKNLNVDRPTSVVRPF